MKPLSILLGCAILLLLTHCLEKYPDGSSARASVLLALAEDVALARFVEFQERSAEMEAAAVAFCADPSEASLKAARDAWWAAKEPWKRNEVVRFGPIMEYPRRFGPKIDDWPVIESAVEDLVDDEGELDQAAFDSMGTGTRGLPVVEYLLWGAGEDTLEALTNSARRCAILEGAARDVHANAGRLVVDWSQTWILQLSQPASAPDARYENMQEVLDEWVNRMGFTVENIRVEKLGKPVGDKADGKPQPDTIESRHSGRSLLEAKDALAGVHDIWTGGSGEESLGVSALVSDTELIALVDTHFEAAMTTLAAIPDTLEDTISGDTSTVVAAQDALRELHRVIQVDLATKIGVTIGFNDSDGD